MKALKAEVAHPRKIALYACMTVPDWYSVMEVKYVNYGEHYQTLPDGQLREMTHDGYVRVTEPTEVTFSAIESDELVARAVESLNESERALLAEMNKRLAELRERKAQLLALTHEVRS